MNYSKTLILLFFFSQPLIYSSSTHDKNLEILALSQGEKENPTLRVDGSLIIYTKKSSIDQIPLPLAKQFTCSFFAGEQDKRNIDIFWFKHKNHSCVQKATLLEEMFVRAHKNTSWYIHASCTEIAQRLIQEEEKLQAFKYYLREFYFYTLNKKTLGASNSAQLIEKLRSIEESEKKFREDDNHLYSSYPNPFLIVLLRELSIVKTAADQAATSTPFLTRLKSHGFFSGLDRLVPTTSNYRSENTKKDPVLFTLGNDDEAPF